MGYNTVAVLYNDVISEIRNNPGFGERVYQAFIKHQQDRDNHLGSNFGYGAIVSCEHADYEQILVVGQNQGRVLEDVNNPSPVMLMRLKDYMEQHGYRVSKRRK